MKLQDILNEGISKILYHYTDTSKLLTICKNNEFRLTGGMGVDADDEHAPKDKNYYLSTARTKHARYTVVSSRANSVVIVLDGNRLAHNYSGKPIDYWGEGMRKYEKGRYEEEDRIFSKTPTIPNAKKYIKSVHVLVEDKDKESYATRTNRRLFLCLKQSGIEFHVYDNKESFLLQDPRKRLKLSELNLKTTSKERKPYTSSGNYDAKKLMGLIELYHKREPDELSKETKKFLYGIRFSPAASITDSIKNALSSIRKDDNPAYSKFYKVFKDSGRGTLLEFIDHILDKWRDRV